MQTQLNGIKFITKEVGDKIKRYELLTDHTINLEKPIICRIDGNRFSKLTKNCDKPFDKDFTKLMQSTTQFAMDYLDATIAETHSDEISLFFNLFPSEPSTLPFNGRLQKLCSIVASKVSTKFNLLLSQDKNLSNKLKIKEPLAVFDCRFFNISYGDVCTYLKWRKYDSYRNSVQALGRKYIPHSQMQNLKSRDITDKLINDHEIFWETELTDDEKWGSYYKKVKIETKFTEEELITLPEKHHAKKNPNLIFTRSQIIKTDFKNLFII